MHVFVVDDDPIYKMIVCRMLKEHASTPCIAVFENGEAALAGLKKNAPALPDIIMLDIEMPVLNGWGFMEAFCKIPDADRKKTRVYIISSSIVNEDISKAAGYPEIVEYIPKPMTREKLNDILKQES